MKREDAITIAATGVNITTSAASANAAIPNTSSGSKPLYVRVTATQPAVVRLSPTAAPVAVATDLMVQPADSVILAVGANGFIAALQVAAAGIVNVAPLEDF